MSSEHLARGPERVIAAALSVEDNNPVIRRISLTSGGGDSSVLAHRCRDHYDELAHIDTGTALPGVREHVIAFAAKLGKPLRILEAGDAYRDLVLGPDEWWDVYYDHRLGPWEGPDEFRKRTRKIEDRDERRAMLAHLAPLGFPGPAGHAFAYQRLKERQLEQMLREIKAEYADGSRAQRVMLLSGVRLDESQRRKMTGTARGEWERRGNQLWVNPLFDWTNGEMQAYRQLHTLKPSDVAAMTHRSGECNCMAFASKGEPQFIASVYPDWYEAKIKPIEDLARERGLEKWQWGWGAGDPPVGGVGLMCQGCEIVGKELMAA